MSDAMEVRIAVDEENSAEMFWEHVNSSVGTPEEIVGFVFDVTVPSSRAKEIEEWCRNAPGFNDGPSHAPTALLFVEK